MIGICKCGHNRSFHNFCWNKFRGEWNTSCQSSEWGRSGRDRCPCNTFEQLEETTVVKGGRCGI